MKALIGIDGDYRYWAALNLLARLKFSEPDWHLVCVHDPFWPADWSSVSQDQAVEIKASDEGRARVSELLEQASDAACKFGVRAEKHIGHGKPAQTLLYDADRIGVDLVAVGSHEKGPLVSAITGSVGRALTVGAQQSVLIGKGTPKTSGTVTAVFATDFSNYANRCLEKLLSWNPKGLAKVVVLFAYPLQEDNSSKNEYLKMLHEWAASSVAKLTKAGIVAEYSLRPGDLHYAIAHEMEIQSADLLIMGAQGHGVLDRLLIGSNALHEAVATDHSVLIIRA